MGRFSSSQLAFINYVAVLGINLTVKRGGGRKETSKERDEHMQDVRETKTMKKERISWPPRKQVVRH